MNNIGVIYKQEKDYLFALECFKKIFLVLEKYLSRRVARSKSYKLAFLNDNSEHIYLLLT